MDNYYNTNHETGATLEESNRKAGKQQDRLLAFFRQSPGKHFSAQEVWDGCFGFSAPFSSVHRSLRNLEMGGFIVKTDVMKVSSYNKHVHTWKTT
jgi:Fe2+ or Zn2+ uptake regulation protein